MAGEHPVCGKAHPDAPEITCILTPGHDKDRIVDDNTDPRGFRQQRGTRHVARVEWE